MSGKKTKNKLTAIFDLEGCLVWGLFGFFVYFFVCLFLSRKTETSEFWMSELSVD